MSWGVGRSISAMRVKSKYLTAALLRRSFASTSLQVPSTMRAVVLPTPGTPDALEMRTIPVRPPGPGEVVVKVDACAVAYRDTLDRRGAFPFIMSDAVLGHEIAGTVVQVGDVDSVANGAKSLGGKLNVGDRVASLHWDQDEAWPAPLTPSGPVNSFLGLTLPGGYAEYCTAPMGCFAPVPSSWTGTAVEAAPVMSTYGTVWQGAVERGSLRRGETVLVTGASGGVGSAAVRLAKRLGCTVIAVTSTEAKQPFIETLGADTVVVAESGENGMAFNKDSAILNNPPDMVIECTGGPGFQASLRSLRPEGRLVLVGNVDNSVGQLPLGLCILKSLSVIGSDSIASKSLVNLFHFLDGDDRRLCSGSSVNPPLRPTVQATLPLQKVAEAHEMLEARAVSGRIVLQISDDTWQ